MKLATDWKDYSVIATGDGEKLEKWGKYTLLRPDPQVIWHAQKDLSKHKTLDAHYLRSNAGGGNWKFINKVPDEWNIEWKDIKFKIKPMGFKHTGLFPEQAVNWNDLTNAIKSANRPIKILNLFAYTGGASVVCAKAGAQVTHVDASKGMVERARENARLNDITTIRYIVDDCKKFIEREIRRGNRYDGIIMDPPSYGRGTNGEMWKLEDNLFDFVSLTKQVLSDNPLFVLISSYTTGLQASVLSNILTLVFGEGNIDADEIGLPTEEKNYIAMWCKGIEIMDEKLENQVEINENKIIESKKDELTVLYEDNHIIVVIKPQNVLSQEDASGDMDVLRMVKSYIKEKYNKEGEAFVGLVHRLDRPTGGIMVFAKTSKAASRLSEEIRSNKMNKTYYAITTKIPQAKQDTLINYLKKDEKNNIVKIVPQSEKGAKIAELSYKVLQTDEENALIEVKLITGRAHQIRVQLAGINCPLFGDNKYGREKTKISSNLGLWAGRLEFLHPTTKQKMTFACPPDCEKMPWKKFYMDKYFLR